MAQANCVPSTTKKMENVKNSTKTDMVTIFSKTLHLPSFWKIQARFFPLYGGNLEILTKTFESNNCVGSALSLTFSIIRIGVPLSKGRKQFFLLLQFFLYFHCNFPSGGDRGNFSFPPFLFPLPLDSLNTHLLLSLRLRELLRAPFHCRFDSHLSLYLTTRWRIGGGRL